MIKKHTLIGILIFVVVGMFAQDDNITQSPAVHEEDLILLDQIELVIFGQNDVEIVTKSDMERPAFGGGEKTEDQLIFEKSVLLDAKKHNVPCEEEDIDAGMEQMKREYNLSQEQLEQIFNESGYTMQEGRDQFKDMQMINTMFGVKVHSQLIIPRKEIQAYYDAHPVNLEATYTLERFFVPFNPLKTEQEQKKQIVRGIKKSGIEGVNSTSSVQFTLNHSEVAPSKHFIYSMKRNSIAGPFETDGGFEIFRLVDKTEGRPQTLEERYHEIADILRRPKYEKLMQEYRDYLMKNVSIIYF